MGRPFGRPMLSAGHCKTLRAARCKKPCALTRTQGRLIAIVVRMGRANACRNEVRPNAAVFIDTESKPQRHEPIRERHPFSA